MAIAAIALVLLGLVAPSLAAPHPFSVYDMVGLDRVGTPVPSPSGTRALFTRWTYDVTLAKSAQSIWITDLTASNVSFAVTTTTYGQSDYNPVWVDDNTFLFLSGFRTASGSAQVFQSTVGGSAPLQLTNYPLDVENLKVFSAKGAKWIGFTSRVYPQSNMEQTREIDEAKAKDPSSGLTYNRLYFRHWDTFSDDKYGHLFVAPLTLAQDGTYSVAAEPTDLLFGLALETPVAPFGGSTDFDFSPDGTEATFAALRPGLDQAWSTDVNIYLVNVTGGQAPRAITEFNPGQDSLPAYSPDGTKIAYLAMRVPKYEADRRRVVVYNRATGVHTTLTEDWDRSPSSVHWSPDSTTLYVAVADEARENIYTINVATKAITFLLKGGFYSGLHVTSRGLVFARNSQLAPNEIYTYSANTVVQRTFINEAKLRDILVSTPEEFWFTGSLGDRVHGWIIKPVGFDASKKYPVAFLVHGGPQSAWLDNFSTRWNPQAFAGAGFAVVAIDPHGSTSYGQAFTDAINGEWGSYPYQDLMIGLDHVIATNSYVDGNRVAALGASYGGYMMNWFNGNTNRFACLVNHCGLSDTTAMYYATEELFFPEYDFRGTPWESFELYEKWNPINLVTNWKTPTLVIHGAKDYRVVDGQGFATFTALQRQGVPSRLLYFPDENHWVIKPANSIRWYSEVLSWITSYTSE